jgi:catechol 2,3-dioxygenase-like lactoylglutathione lyase family enzyme
MQLKHLNLTTSDVPALAAFFERHFGFTRAVERGTGGFILLRNADDFFLAVMRGKKDDAIAYPKSFHVGFYLDGLEAVQAKHDELESAGLSPGKIQTQSDSGWGTHFYCTAPGDVMVEIAVAPTPQDAAARQSTPH